MGDGDLRIQLEGRAVPIEANLARYRLLVDALGSLRWKHQLRRLAAVLRELAQADHEVQEALPEVWPRVSAAPPGSELRSCVEEVLALRSRLEALAGDRLGVQAHGQNLGARLLLLEEQVVDEPRHVLPHQRSSVALEVLPRSLPEVARLRLFGASAERLFSRPIAAQRPLPFSLDEWREFADGWLEGLEALSDAWARLTHIDLTGGVARSLRLQATRAPLARPQTGPELLAHAEFWKGVAASRIDQVVRARISPVVPPRRRAAPALRVAGAARA